MEAEDDGQGTEGHAESASWLIRRIRLIDIRPAHVNMLDGQASHRVRELHGGCVVQLEQTAPAERREDLGQVTNGQVRPRCQVYPVNRVSQLRQVLGALLQRR